MSLIEFECQGYRFGMPLSYVNRVLPSAQPFPLPGAPDLVLGMLNIGGELAVIINFSHRIGLSLSSIELDQQLLLIKLEQTCLGLMVDRVIGVTEREIQEENSVPVQYAGDEFVDSVYRLDDGLSIICNPEKFLLDDEKMQLGRALEQARYVE